MLFRPTPIDERALAQFATADEGRPISFWLIDEREPDGDLSHGHPLEYMQVCTLERLSDSPLRTKGGSLENPKGQSKQWAPMT
jgi:hypothetical protein